MIGLNPDEIWNETHGQALLSLNVTCSGRRSPAWGKWWPPFFTFSPLPSSSSPLPSPSSSFSRWSDSDWEVLSSETSSFCWSGSRSMSGLWSLAPPSLWQQSGEDLKKLVFEILKVFFFYRHPTLQGPWPHIRPALPGKDQKGVWPSSCCPSCIPSSCCVPIILLKRIIGIFYSLSVLLHDLSPGGHSNTCVWDPTPADSLHGLG